MKVVSARVDCDQPGVTLSLSDGDFRELPVVVALKPGEHTLRFSGERYKPLEKTVTVVLGRANDLGKVRLEVARCHRIS